MIFDILFILLLVCIVLYGCIMLLKANSISE